MIKKNIFLFFVIITITNSYCQNKQCSDFRIGKFEYTNPNYSDWKVIRTDSTQTEINSKSKIVLQATIIWKSDCEYVLTYEKITNSDLKDLIGKKVFVEIFEIENKKFKYHSKLDDMEITTEMIKVE